MITVCSKRTWRSIFPRTNKRHHLPILVATPFSLRTHAPTHARLSQSAAEPRRRPKTPRWRTKTRRNERTDGQAGKAGTDAAAAWPAPTWRGRVSLVGRDSYMRDLYPACNIGQWARAIADGNADVRAASRRAAPRAQRARTGLPRLLAWPSSRCIPCVAGVLSPPGIRANI